MTARKRMTMNMETERILRIVEAGHYIRLMDGRWSDGYVHMETLKKLIEEKRVEVFTNKGVKMVRKLAAALTHQPGDGDAAE
jgi:hypothetical protein